MPRPTCRRSKYPELGARYRHHYMAHQNDISLFDGVLPLLARLKARGHWLAVATGKSRRGLDEVLHAVELKGRVRRLAHRRRDRRQAASAHAAGTDARVRRRRRSAR